jgi:uncharacterized protein YbjT (DUF2867 family)
MSKPYLMIGATRGTGMIIATRLLEMGFPVRVLARDTAKARAVYGTSAEIVRGDLAYPDDIFTNAFRDIEHIVYTASVPRGMASEEQIQSVDYGGIVSTIRAAKTFGFSGRFLYMSTIGTTHHSMAGIMLDVLRGGNMRWRREAEKEVRLSGLRQTIIRAGMLTNDAGGTHNIVVKSGDVPLKLRYKIGRSDVAECFLQSLRHATTENKEMSIYWTRQNVQPIETQLLQV